MLTFGSLFAGIGGIDLGLERAGMRCAWQVEIDDYCNRVLAKHWPDVPRYRDVRSVGAHNLPVVDLIAGGFPCQPHSSAGKRRGADDERDLWPQFRRVICELRPRWVLAENVPGLLSSDHGRFFGSLLGDLAALGYDTEWHCIPAASIGAPHIRDRVYIVAHAGSGRCGASIDDVAHTSSPRNRRLAARQQGPTSAPHDTNGRSQVVADAERGLGKDSGDSGRREQPSTRETGWHVSFWTTEPDVGRVADGIPHRVDRLRGLGNAVVPQVAEFIGRCILEAQP